VVVSADERGDEEILREVEKRVSKVHVRQEEKRSACLLSYLFFYLKN